MNQTFDTDSGVVSIPALEALLADELLEGKNIQLAELIPAEQLQAMLKRFSSANGVVCVIHDRDGNPVVHQGYIRETCSQMQHAGEKCIGEDVLIHRKTVECGHCRLSKATEPIYIGGQHVADWSIGMCGFGGVISPFVEASCGSIEKYTEFYEQMSAQIKAHFDNVCSLLKLAVADVSHLGYSNLKLMREHIRRRENEVRLEESRGLFRSVFDNSVDGILIIGQDGTVQEWSSGFENLSGIPREKAAGRKMHDVLISMLDPDVYTAEEIEQIYGLLDTYITRQEQVTVVRHIINRQTQQRCIIQTLYFPLHYAGTNMTGAISRDITENVHRERELIAEKERIQSLGDNYPGGCLYRATLDMATRQFKLTYLSKTWEELSGGISIEAALNDFNTVLGIIFPEDVQVLLDAVTYSAETMTNMNTELRFMFAGKVQKWAQIASHPHLEGHVVVWDGFILNITERKNAEIKLEDHLNNLEQIVKERTEEMEAANEELYATNEELYATNEEFAVTNEELHSKNDQLNQEIAARIEIMQQLEDSESKMRNFIAQSVEGIIILDEEGRVIEWNPEQERITGISCEAATGRYSWELYRDLLPMDQAEEKVEQYRRNQVMSFLKSDNKKRVEESEHVIRTVDGTEKYISVISFQIALTDKCYVGEIIRDTTERKMIDLELERYRTQLEEMVAAQTREIIISKERLTQLSDNLPGGVIYQMCSRSGQALCFSYISARFEDIFNMTIADVMNDCSLFFAMLHPQDGEELIDLISASDQTEFVDKECRMTVRTGESKWIHIRSSYHMQDDGTNVWDGFMVDITDRKLAEQELEETRRRQNILIKVLQTVQTAHSLDEAIGHALSEIGEYAGVSRSYIFEKAADGKTANNVYEWCNEGISPEIDNLQDVPIEYMNDWFDTFARGEYVCASSLNEIEPIAAEKLSQQGIKSILVLPLKSKGETYGFVGFDECVQPRHWQQKEIALLVSLSQIIASTTIRFRAEKAMKLSQQTMRTVLDNINASIYVANFDNYEVLFANKNAKDLMGANIEGQTCWKVMQNGMTGPCSFCPNSKLLDADGKPTGMYNWEFQNSNTGGWYECSDAAIEWVDGRLVHMEYATDITMRRYAEDARRQSEELYRQLTVASPDAIVVSDTHGKVIYLSPKAHQLFFIAGDRTTENTYIADYVHPHDRKRAIEMFRTVASGASTFIPQILLMHEDGTEFFGEVSSATVRDNNDRITSVIMVVRDITDRRLSEMELIRAKEKAEESDKLKSAFLANMSHEIRTPINGINGFLNFLADENLSPRRRQEYITIVNNSSTQLVKLIDDIIDVAKIEARQMNIHPTPIRLNPFMSELHVFFETYLRSANKDRIALVLDDSQFTDPDLIFVDQMRLRQILTNLIGNAAKFTEKGFIGFGYRMMPPDKLEFWVEDSGIGLPPDQLEVIFERFRQAELTNIRKYGGTGLGLTISRSLAQMMGGDIGVESVEGQGSTFRFTISHLPVSPDDEAIFYDTALPNQPVVSRLLEKKSILLVEPEIMTSCYYEKILSASGATTICTQTVKQWIDTVSQQRHLDAIVADARVFIGEDGGAARAVRSLRAGLPLTLIVPARNEFYNRIITETRCDVAIEGTANCTTICAAIRKNGI